MVVTVHIAMMVADMASLLVAVPGHLGILLVYLHDLIRKRGLDIKDQLFCGLSICNPLHGLFQALIDFILFVDVTLIGTFYVLLGILLVQFTTMSCTLFFSTWLSVYFCLKIVNLNKSWYICLQRGFPKIFPWLLLALVLGSILCSFPLAFYYSRLYASHNMTVSGLFLNGVKSFFLHPSLLVSMRCYIAMSLLLFTLFFISSCPIIVSLYQHMKRIQVSTAGSRIPTLEPHIYAVQTITLLMILNILYFFSLILFVMNEHEVIVYYSSVALFNVCHIASFVISIRGNQKVRNKIKVNICNMIGMRVLSVN